MKEQIEYKVFGSNVATVLRGLRKRGIDASEVGEGWATFSAPRPSPQEKMLEEFLTQFRAKKPTLIDRLNAFGTGGYVPLEVCRNISREYSEEEINAAEALHLLIEERLGRAEQYGTVYDYSSVCKKCSWNYRRQVSDLVVDRAALFEPDPDTGQRPGLVDFLQTYEGHVVISGRAKEAIKGAQLTGCHVGVVRGATGDLQVVSRFQPEKIADLVSATMRWPVLDGWHHLQITGTAGRIITGPGASAVFGMRCPACTWIGEQLDSELFIHREKWDGTDWAVTTTVLGAGFEARPLVVVSKKCYVQLRKAMLTGFRVEPCTVITS